MDFGHQGYVTPMDQGLPDLGDVNLDIPMQDAGPMDPSDWVDTDL